MTRHEKLKNLLGIVGNDKDFIIEFVLGKVSDMVCNYCNIKEIPQGLENVLLNMAVDLYRAEGLGQEQIQGAVKSITEGDVTVSFSSASSVSDNPGMAFLKNYTKQLDRYRKAGW
ncbi:MAG: hypothetical protein GX299_06985 [Epulopiscium sp.]|jgi:hypothetical protein|nr:hypothetical protein [Candidatus Epulonipiscium sp.]